MGHLEVAADTSLEQRVSLASARLSVFSPVLHTLEEDYLKISTDRNLVLLEIFLLSLLSRKAKVLYNISTT